RLRRFEGAGGEALRRDLADVAVREIHFLKRGLELRDGDAAEAPALQADDVEADDIVAFRGHREMRHVARDRGMAGDHHAFADATELMHRRAAAEERVIADGDVPG